MEWYWKKLCNN